MLATPLSAGVAVSALQVLAEVYEKIGDYEAAAQAHVREIDLEPKEAWLKGNYASFLIRRGEYDAAIAMAKKALAQMDYGVAHHTLAKAHCVKGEQHLWDRNNAEAARKEFEAADAASPGYARAAYDLGAYHQYIGRTRDKKELDVAKTYFAKAAALEPKDPLAKEALAAVDR